MKQFNGTVTEPYSIPSKTKEKDKSNNKYNHINWDSFEEETKILFSKELVFMFSVSTVWFITFI